MDTEIFNLKEACDYLGVSLVTLRKRIKQGLLHPITDPVDNRQKLIAKSELDSLKFPKFQEE